MTIRIGAATFLFALSGTVASAGPPSVEDPVAELVRLMWVGPVHIANIRNQLASDPKARALPQPVKDCFQNRASTFAHDVYGVAIQEILTAGEIQSALDYYRSHAGYMNQMLSLRKNRASLVGMPALAEADAAGEPTPEERSQMVEFARSPAGKKIGQIARHPTLLKLTDEHAIRMASECLDAARRVWRYSPPHDSERHAQGLVVAPPIRRGPRTLLHT